VYKPDPLGQPPARAAVSRYYGGAIPDSQIVLTPGTSVSYWYCFKLLAEPGDEILTPQPSYPLFDYIAQLCGVTLTPYELDEARNCLLTSTTSNVK
jgi:aspartate/methionine/tyrosine aminotransferase